MVTSWRLDWGASLRRQKHSAQHIWGEPLVSGRRGPAAVTGSYSGFEALLPRMLCGRGSRTKRRRRTGVSKRIRPSTLVRIRQEGRNPAGGPPARRLSYVPQTVGLLLVNRTCNLKHYLADLVQHFLLWQKEMTKKSPQLDACLVYQGEVFFFAFFPHTF